MPRLRYIKESEQTPHTRELIESARRISSSWASCSVRGGSTLTSVSPSAAVAPPPDQRPVQEAVRFRSIPIPFGVEPLERGGVVFFLLCRS